MREMTLDWIMNNSKHVKATVLQKLLKLVLNTKKITTDKLFVSLY